MGNLNFDKIFDGNGAFIWISSPPFDGLYPTWKAHEIQVIRTVIRKRRVKFCVCIERTCTLFPTMSQRFSNLLWIDFMFIYEWIVFLGFFDLKLSKWDTFQAMKEESFVRLLTCQLMFLYNQSKLTTFAKKIC